MVVPTLMQLSFSGGTVIVDAPSLFLVVAVTSGLAAAAAVLLVLISRAFWKSLQVF